MLSIAFNVEFIRFRSVPTVKHFDRVRRRNIALIHAAVQDINASSAKMGISTLKNSHAMVCAKEHFWLIP